MDQNSRNIDLKPNSLLIDSNFEGYKLSLEPIPVYCKLLDSGVHVVQTNDDQFSFFHIKTFSLHNHLYVNKYKPENLYFVDKQFKVQKINFSIFNHAISVKEVFELPKVDVNQKGKYNISVVFTGPASAIISDGGGTAYAVKILDTSDGEVWKMCHPDNFIKENTPYLVLDGRMETVDGHDMLHVLLTQIEEKHVAEDTRLKKEGLFFTKLKWRAFHLNNCATWNEKFEKVLYFDGYIEYASLEPGCQSIYVVCDKLPQWISDSENPVNSENYATESQSHPKLYSWTQTDEEISLWFDFENNVKKEEIKITFENLKCEIHINGEEFFNGKFFHNIDSSLCSWCFEKNKLEVQLIKKESGLMWKELFVNDDRGEEIVDPATVERIHERLSHLCSDKEEKFQGTFTGQQLEECDAPLSESTSLIRIDGEKHGVTHQVSLSSSQWLFKVDCDSTQSPALCCRHDVDACVWQFKQNLNKTTESSNWPHEHLGTFSAFGYVQASKSQKKFLVSPPNLSYAAICEASRHIYIYRQPLPINSELKNRHTGKKVNKISKQQVINIETGQEILGIYAANNTIYVLSADSVHVFIVND